MKMVLHLASFYGELQVYPMGAPDRQVIGTPPLTKIITVKTYKDPIDGKVYALSHVKFLGHRLDLVSPWAMVKTIQMVPFCRNKGFHVLDSSVPEGTEASFNAMDKKEKRVFIMYLIQKAYPAVNLQGVIDADPTNIGLVSGQGTAPSLSADELRRLNVHMNIQEPVPAPKQVLHKSAEDLISAMEGGKEPDQTSPPFLQDFAQTPESKAAPAPTAPEETANPNKPEDAIPGMPEKHHVTKLGKIFCAGPCDRKKSFAGTRTHRQHLVAQEKCRVLYPDGYFPRPTVDKPDTEVSAGAALG